MINDRRNSWIGTISALLAFLLWGILPVYWKLLGAVPAAEQLAHRIIWSAVLLLGAVLIFKRRELRLLFRDPRAVLVAMLAGLLLGGNWGIYIWAVASDRIVEASLGYYINPLVSVLLGVIFLRERLTRAQIVALLLAAAGVLILTVSHGRFPWISIALGFSFGIYGLVKKTGRLGNLMSLFTELLILAPIAATYLLIIGRSGESSFSLQDGLTTSLLVGAGAVTVAPLLLFGAAARRIPLSRVGFLQYVGPTVMLMVGTLVYNEPFTTAHLVSFALIWVALAIYAATLFRDRAAARSQNGAESPEK